MLVGVSRNDGKMHRLRLALQVVDAAPQDVVSVGEVLQSLERGEAFWMPFWAVRRRVLPWVVPSVGAGAGRVLDHLEHLGQRLVLMRQPLDLRSVVFALCPRKFHDALGFGVFSKKKCVCLVTCPAGTVGWDLGDDKGRVKKKPDN